MTTYSAGYGDAYTKLKGHAARIHELQLSLYDPVE